MLSMDEIGPLLQRVIDVQRADADALRFPDVVDHCRALESLCQRLNDPVVLAVGAGAQQLVGAATVVAEGRVRSQAWGDIHGQRVLLVALTTVTTVALSAAMAQA